MEKPYSRFVNAMREEGKYGNGFPMTVCEVLSIEPLTIHFQEVVIDHNIYCNEAYICPEDPLEEILTGEEYLSEALKIYLININKKLKINSGDLVAVQRVDNSFYVLGKVVQM